ncbi:hypothetical protein BZA70DRAFT_268477 [Myxozyma melibiosi]|uniref:Uncharacterized protein n=1 Tax=Myxozyma melibiosi TaxID=54550 RepID=A0ABR1F2K2_9ASCO
MQFSILLLISSLLVGSLAAPFANFTSIATIENTTIADSSSTVLDEASTKPIVIPVITPPDLNLTEPILIKRDVVAPLEDETVASVKATVANNESVKPIVIPVITPPGLNLTGPALSKRAVNDTLFYSDVKKREVGPELNETTVAYLRRRAVEGGVKLSWNVTSSAV